MSGGCAAGDDREHLRRGTCPRSGRSPPRSDHRRTRDQGLDGKEEVADTFGVLVAEMDRLTRLEVLRVGGRRRYHDQRQARRNGQSQYSRMRSLPFFWITSSRSLSTGFRRVVRETVHPRAIYPGSPIANQPTKSWRIILWTATYFDLRSSRPAEDWSSWSPMPSLSPEFAVEPGSAGDAILRISGAGNAHGFGAWTERVPARPGVAYRLRVALRSEGVDNLFLQVTPHIVWRRGDMALGRCLCGGRDPPLPP